MLLGFDLYSANDKINNIYKGTQNYKDKDANPVDPSYWIYQIGKVFDYHPNKQFIVWNHEDWKMPRIWQKKNVQFESFNKN